MSAYIVAGLQPERIRPILDVAMARFEQEQALRQELDLYVCLRPIQYFKGVPDLAARGIACLIVFVALAIKGRKQTGRSVELLDVDELLEANTAGILDPKTSERAMLNAARAIEGIAAHGHDLDAWLTSVGMPVTWR